MTTIKTVQPAAVPHFKRRVLSESIIKFLVAAGGVWSLSAAPALAAPDQVIGWPQDRIYVRPGETSYRWTWGNSSLGSIGPMDRVTLFSTTDHTPPWILETGYFQYSTNDGATWINYDESAAVPQYINTQSTVWRFVNTRPQGSSPLKTDRIGFGFYVGDMPNGTSGMYIAEDAPPTAITVSPASNLIPSGIPDGANFAQLSAVDTGLLSSGKWVLKAQSHPGLISVNQRGSSNHADLAIVNTALMPAAGTQVSVTVVYHDIYQLDDAGQPIPDSGVESTINFTVQGASSDSIFNPAFAVDAAGALEGSQEFPSVSALNSGGFIVSWVNANGAVVAQRFTDEGVPDGSQITVEDSFESASTATIGLANGGFAVAYVDGDSADIWITFFDAENARLNSHQLGLGEWDGYSKINLAVDPSAAVLVVSWSLPDFSTVKRAAYLADGQLMTPAHVAGELEGYGPVSTIVSDSTVVTAAVNAELAYGISLSIGLRHINPGSVIGETFEPPAIVALNAGFALAWVDYTEDPDYGHVYVQTFDNSGTATSAITRVNTRQGEWHYQPVLSALNDGGFIVSWQSEGVDGHRSGVFARRFSATAVPVDTDQFQVNQYSFGDQQDSGIAVLTSGNFVSVWTDLISGEDSVINARISDTVLPEDTTAPTITSVEVPADGWYKAGDSLDFYINLSEPITVNTTAGTPYLTLQVGGSTRHASYVSIDGRRMKFSYALADDLDNGGITITGLNLNGAVLADAANSPLDTTLSTIPSTSGINVDALAPHVTDISLKGTPATNEDTRTFVVTFNESVTGVSTYDFDFAYTGTAGGVVNFVSGSGSSYEVGVTVSGQGTLQLQFKPGASVKDKAGNGAVEYVGGGYHAVDRVAPDAPSEPIMATESDTGYSPSDGITTIKRPVLLGSAERRSQVTIISDLDGELGTAATDAEGNWHFTPPDDLTEGIHELRAYAADEAGNVSEASATGYIQIDNTAPAISSWTSAATDSPTGVVFSISFSENVTDVGAEDFVLTTSGSAEGEITNVVVGEGSAEVTVSNVSGTGNLFLSVVGGGISDLAGNPIIAVDLGSHALDRDAPDQPPAPVLSAEFDTGISNSDAVTNIAQPEFTGIAEAGSTVLITSAEGGLLGTTVADRDGNWRFAPELPLVDGSDLITVQARDEAGNTSVASPALAITIDTTAPDATSSVMTDIFDATTAVFTVNFNESVFGFGSTAFSLTTTDTASGIISDVIAGEGNSVNVTVTDISGTGSLRLDVNGTGITDQAGNVVTAFTGGTAHQVDLDAPEVDSVSFDQAAVNSANQAAISFTLAGAEVGATAHYSITSSEGGTPVTGDIVINAANQQIAGLDVSGLNDGILTVTVTLTDASGNVGRAADITVLKDTVAPLKPLVPGLASESDTGIYDNDGVTKLVRPIIKGQAEAGSTITINAGTTTLGTAIADGDGNWSFTPAVDLPEGTHNINVHAVDQAGNTSDISDVFNIQIDTTAPVATLSATSAHPADGSAVFTVGFDDTVYGFDTQSFVLTPTGTASGVIAEVTAAEGNVVDVTVTNITGTGSLRLDVAGTGITDLAGNVVSAFTGGTAHQVDLEAPEVDSVSFDQTAVNSANQAAISFTLAGAEVDATAFYTITSSEGGTPVTGDIVINAANQQVAGIDVSGLADGTLTVTVNLIDAAYNAGAEATAIVEKDTVAPAQPAQPDLLAESDSGFSDTDNITNGVRPQLAGTAEADSTVEIYLEDATTSEGAIWASVTADPSGNWTYEPDADLVEGVYNITVTSIDLAGNISAESAALNLTIDTTAPGISSVSFDEAMVDGTNVNAQSFTLSDAELGVEASYSITNSEGGVSVTGDFTVTDADQQITVPSLVSLEDGNLILDLTLTDAAGNTRVETDVIVKNVNPVLALPLDLIEATDGSTIAVPDVVISGSVSSSITVEITVTDGTVKVDASRLGAVAGNATASLTLEGGLAEINAALATLTYAAPVNATGLRDLLVTVEDDLGSAAGAISLQIHDRADISNIDGSTVTYYYGSNSVQVTQANVVITDLDNTDFGGGVLTFGIVDRVRALDMVSIVETSDVKLGGETYGSAVQVDGVLIGTLRNTFGPGEDVQVGFNSNATPVAVAKLLKALTFATDDEGPGNGSRTLEIRLNDGKAVRTVTVDVLLRPAPEDSGDIDGGVISYPVEGTPDAPVRINNARVVNGASLSNVIIGANTVMESGVIIGENVRFESEATIPAGLDLTGALRSLNWQTGDERSVVMLDGDVLVPGASDDDMTIIRAIQLLGEYEPAGNQLEQDQQTGEILVVTADFRAAVLPVTVTMAGPGDQPGTYINENGDVVFVSVNRRVVLSYPVLASKPGFMAMLAGAGLQITYDERANMQVFSSTIQVDGREIQTVTAEGGEFYYSARPDVLSLPAHRSQTPGLVEYALPGLGSPRGLSMVYEEEGVLREQDLVPASPDWFGLKDSLLAIDGIESVSIDAQGIITVMLDGQTIRARLEYVVFVGREQAGEQVIIREAGDKTGNGTMDYEVVYTNGNVQYLYVY